MIPIRVVTIQEEHPDLVRRELHEVTRLAHYAMGRKWAEDLLAEHFLPSASSIFGYQPRSAKWLKRKRLLVAIGQADPDAATSPLVFRGRLRAALLRTARNAIRAYPTRVTIDLIGTEYFTARPRRPGRPNFHREVTAMSPRHERLVGDSADRGFEQGLRLIRQSRRTTKTTKTS